MNDELKYIIIQIYSGYELVSVILLLSNGYLIKY